MDYDDFRDEASDVYVAADIIVALAFFSVALLGAAMLIGLGLWLI